MKTWNEAAFRQTFHPAANISQYYVKQGAIKTITLDEFVATIASLHKKFDNAEEVAEEMEVTRTHCEARTSSTWLFARENGGSFTRLVISSYLQGE